MKRENDLVIRGALTTDVEALRALRLRLHEETRFLRLSPFESRLTPEQYASVASSQLSRSDSLVLLAECGDDLVGYLGALFNARTLAVETVATGVLGDFWGRGLGGRMLERMERWGRARGATRILLSVMKENVRAAEMYQRRGYARIGESSFTLYGTDEVVGALELSKTL